MSASNTTSSSPVNLAEALVHPRGAVIVLLAMLGILMLVFCAMCMTGCCYTAVVRFKTRNPARLTTVEATYSEVLTPDMDAEAENLDAVLIEMVSEEQTSATEAVLSTTATATGTTAVQAVPVSISVLSSPLSDGQSPQSRSNSNNRGFSLQLERTARTLSNLSSLVR